MIHFIATDRESVKFQPEIAAIETDSQSLSENAVSMLRELMANGRTNVMQRSIPAKFVIRDSVIDRSNIGKIRKRC